jgi:hypothetical protein
VRYQGAAIGIVESVAHPQGAGKGEGNAVNVAPLQLRLFKQRGRAPRRALDPSELQIQISVVARLRLQCRPGIVWYHCPNGELRPDKQGAKLKAMGVRRGVSDLQFIFPDGRPNLFLELKARGRPLNDDQKIFRDDVRAAGHTFEMADTIDEAIRILRQHRVLP